MRMHCGKISILAQQHLFLTRNGGGERPSNSEDNSDCQNEGYTITLGVIADHIESRNEALKSLVFYQFSLKKEAYPNRASEIFVK